MKKIFRYGVIVLVFVLPAISFAMEFRASEQISLRKDEIIKDDIYMAGGSVVSVGNVAGDLFAAGGNVIISGDVESDAFIGGGNVSILSNIGDDLRVGGGTVVVNGKVEGDVAAGGGQVTLSGPGVGGDAAIAGGIVHLDAPVEGDIFLAGGNIYINTSIGGNVKIEAEKITLGSSAVISGNLTYKSKEELTKETGAIIKGEITFTPILNKDSKAPAAFFFSGFLLWKFFSLLACSLLFGLIFRRYSGEIVNLSFLRPTLEIGRGIIFLIALPVISILLFVTLVGIPFGVLGLLSFLAIMLFVSIATPIVVGSIAYSLLLKRDKEVSWKTIFLGVLLYVLLGLVPFIGWLIQFLLTLLTLGCVVALEWQIIKDWR